MKYVVLLLTLLLLLTSCATEAICDDDNQSYMVARFKTLEDGLVSDSIVSGMTIYGIREGKADSLLYDSISMSRAELPLDPNNDISRFVLSNGISRDTVFLSHSSEVYLINYTCGFASRFTLEEYTSARDWIKDVELRDGKIDAELETDEEHLWIYF